MPDSNQSTKLARAALEVARRSMQNGNLPFGCILADESGSIIEEAENTVLTTKDSIGHCEINLIHQLAGKYEQSYLERCSIYASTEPCPMCTAAIFWSGVGSIVYALSKKTYNEIAGTTNSSHIFHIPPSELLSHGKRKVQVMGPLLENEAAELYTKWLKSK